MSSRPWIVQLFQEAVFVLRAKQVAAPEKKVEELLKYLLGCSRASLYGAFVQERKETLSYEECALALKPLLHRVAEGEPVEYVVGHVLFYDCKIGLNRSVLIPRVETELLLEHVIQRLTGREKRVVDIGTGSGCLAIALKKRIPSLEVWATDLSVEALGVAEANGKENGVEVYWRQGDFLAPFQKEKVKFDVVISNPPYLSEMELKTLSPEVQDYEPHLALLGGIKGTEFYDRFAKELPSILNSGAFVYFEIGSTQGSSVLNIFSSSKKWQFPSLQFDWAGHHRFFSSIFLEGE